MPKKTVAIIGYGALGSILASALRQTLPKDYQVSGIWTRHIQRDMERIRQDGFRPYGSFEALLADKPDYAVEIASGEAVHMYGKALLCAGISLIVTSVGALAEDALRESLAQSAQASGTRIYVTSGAVGGFDVLQTVALMGNAKGCIENIKAPESLNGAPYLEGKSLPLGRQQTIFQGTAREAIAGFPKNVNVAVASALASVGVDAMQVVIDSCPGKQDNLHRITVENDGVRAVIEVTSRPNPGNPRSSIMTAWSVVALLRNLSGPIQFF